MPGCEPFTASGDDRGVLVLHGFTGNPQSMRPLATRLAAEGYSVSLPRLPGHGTTVEDMMTTDWSDWSSAARQALTELRRTAARVAVVGLSMGGSLASLLAEENPDLSAVVLINPLVKAPPLEMIDGLSQLLASGVETIDSIGSDIKKEGSKEASYNATPLACAQSLFEGVAHVEAGLSRIGQPVLLLSSRDDHVVTSDNGDAVVAHATGKVERVWLEESYHVATLDNDAPLVEDLTVAFLTRHFG